MAIGVALFLCGGRSRGSVASARSFFFARLKESRQRHEEVRAIYPWQCKGFPRPLASHHWAGPDSASGLVPSAPPCVRLAARSCGACCITWREGALRVVLGGCARRCCWLNTMSMCFYLSVCVCMCSGLSLGDAAAHALAGGALPTPAGSTTPRCPPRTADVAVCRCAIARTPRASPSAWCRLSLTSRKCPRRLQRSGVACVRGAPPRGG